MHCWKRKFIIKENILGILLHPFYTELVMTKETTYPKFGPNSWTDFEIWWKVSKPVWIFNSKTIAQKPKHAF